MSIDTLSSLRHRNFRLFWTGQVVSQVGTWLQSVALSWLVLSLTNSAFLLGAVSAIGSAPVPACCRRCCFTGSRPGWQSCKGFP